jgi:hypothetical protein
MTLELQSPDLGYINLVLNSTDDQGKPASKTYKLSYDYRAIKRAEDSLGVDLKNFDQWSKVKSSMTPEIVHAGLAKFHPDVTLDEVIDQLSPDAQIAIQNAVFDLLFPGIIAQIEKLKAEKEKVEVPNGQSATSVAA